LATFGFAAYCNCSKKRPSPTETNSVGFVFLRASALISSDFAASSKSNHWSSKTRRANMATNEYKLQFSIS
jgi:hypothetical protein